MVQALAILMLLVMGPQEISRARTQPSAGANQRITELQNRHDRRFRSDWSPRQSMRSRAR
jgi:hypothetical protein